MAVVNSKKAFRCASCASTSAGQIDGGYKLRIQLMPSDSTPRWISACDQPNRRSKAELTCMRTGRAVDSSQRQEEAAEE